MIPLKEGFVHVRKNPRMMNPKLKPLVKLELKKTEKAGITFFRQIFRMDFKLGCSNKEKWSNSYLRGFLRFKSSISQR